MAMVVPHDPHWRDRFAAEADAVGRVFGPALAAIEHIGSTAVPEILAKPIVDMLGIAASLAAIDAIDARGIGRLGYTALGEYGLEGRRYFRKDDARGARAYHLHVFAAGHPAIERHLAFRDYLRAHCGVAADYSALKASLAGRDDYQQAKAAFVVATVEAAVAWRRGTAGG